MQRPSQIFGKLVLVVVFTSLIISYHRDDTGGGVCAGTPAKTRRERVTFQRSSSFSWESIPGGLKPIEEWFLQIRPNRSDYTSRVPFVGGTYFTSKRDSEIVRRKRATTTQRHDLTPKVSNSNSFTSICALAFPIAVSASVPPAHFQLVSTHSSSGANITACNKHYPPSYTAVAR
ncbi:hypothetical protein TNCV_618471 [Trichonephila clavipes]|nr:hypothetical protein TNCV_618471 [Trichonephila clavipes]